MMDKLITCLLIDDDQDDHEFFSIALKQAFPQAACACVSNCLEATNQLHNKIIPIPDYIFMDWNLPYLEAKECVKCLKALSGLEKTCIFILSGSIPFVSVKELNELGLQKVLKKQDSVNRLSEEIAAAIH